jgi:hypothetical protein
LWGTLFPAFCSGINDFAFCASHRNLGLAASVWPLLLTVGLADSAHSSISARVEILRQLGSAEGIIHAFLALILYFYSSLSKFWIYFCILRHVVSSKVRPSGECAYLDLGKPALAYCPGRLTTAS